MTNFVYDNIALPADKIDADGGSAPLTNPTRQWGANDINRVFAGLTGLRTALVDQAVRGALGDGVTDETAAIQARLDAAEGASGTVFLPSGVHMISDTLFIPNKVVLTGIGRNDLGKLKASATFPTDGRPMIRLGRAVDSLVFGCRVERLMIDANSRAAVGLLSTAANEQSGARFCVVTNFTQYGIHMNGGSIFSIEDAEVLPQAGGATTGIYLQNCAGDNLVRHTTIGVSGHLANGLHMQASQCLAQNIHVEDCTIGVNIDSSSVALISVSGPTVIANVPDLVVEQGNTRYSVALNLVKNSATRTITANFGGYTNADPFMPLWVGGDSILAGATHFAREVTPGQITANQNDYNPGNFSSAQALHISSDAARDITGIIAANSGRLLWIYNIGAFNITLKHQNAGSAVANRIIGRANADTILLPGTGVQARYSTGTARWIVLNAP